MKRKWIPEPDEFFVGYLPIAPTQTANFLRWVIIGIGVTIVILGLSLSVSQREFSSTTFEYGKLTTIEGYIFKSPVPHIRVVHMADSVATIENRTLLLVGFGKAGAERTMAGFETHLGPFDGKFVKLSGQLIHENGKGLIQISDDILPVILEKQSMGIPLQFTVSNLVTLKGEIIDPKCYFGVMKPGEGKPHRSCAIRCIAGGIPPVFHDTVLSEYFLLLDEKLEPINSKVLDFVGDQIVLTGKSIYLDNWRIFLVNDTVLKKQAMTAKLNRNLMAMEKGMSVCGIN